MTSLNAQIGNLGMYGGVPAQIRGITRYVKLTLNPDPTQGEGIPPWSYTIPVNGLSNYNFYYTPDGTAFLQGGGYRIDYLTASQTPTGNYELVNYSPNSQFTNGVQVHPFNNPPSTPRGIHGVIQVYNKDGEIKNLANANVVAFPFFDPNSSTNVRSNGNGFFSVYYKQSGSLDSFLPVQPFGYELYYFLITGSLGKCSYFYLDSMKTYRWQPQNTTDPNSSSYYVGGAEVVVDDIEPLACT